MRAELGRENELKLHVKQYIPKDNLQPKAGDVTIIGATANAYPKEIHEPLWDDFYHSLKTKFGRKIRSIWIADPVNTGQSGVMNENILGPNPSWFDHGRDLMFLINQFQDDIPHPIIGIGHSMGAGHLAHLALLHPRLLDAVVLMDPVIQLGGAGQNWAHASTYRRDLWPSRDNAAEGMRRSKGLQAWDRRCLEKFIEHGLREVPTEVYPDLDVAKQQAGSEKDQVPVTLQTTKGQEQYNYIRPIYHDPRTLVKEEDRFLGFAPGDVKEEEGFGREEKIWFYRRLPELQPSTLFVFGEKSEVSPREAREEKLRITGTGPGGNGGAARGRVQSAVIECGHLVPLEKPKEDAEICAAFVGQELKRWEVDEAERKQVWQNLTRRERVDLNDLWREHVGPPPARPPKQSEKTKL
ncbi:Abhydrolase domain-containing protein mpaH [Pseudocercospora fuligena]|uniref:Abhydrolase domain-containing protein mpaH n=1 Tax=Pseudocercospora fuligena TaxID=685502 RepID=A0A8H6VIM6_9PEZI|nr:Abhydrolase domain-containing protein mpaH [Pseudocercospora fuligena]